NAQQAGENALTKNVQRKLSTKAGTAVFRLKLNRVGRQMLTQAGKSHPPAATSRVGPDEDIEWRADLFASDAGQLVLAAAVAASWQVGEAAGAVRGTAGV